MSLPDFPEIDSALTREDSLNRIISSIAMEELALSHILNAEGEKLQYALGTLLDTNGAAEPPTIQQLLELNKSVGDVLNNALQTQTILKAKLQSVLGASIMRGPTGATGPVGTILGSYENLDELETEHPAGNQGDAYLVCGKLYVWNILTQTWINTGDLTGPAGPMGPRGLEGMMGPEGHEGPQGVQGIAGTVGTIKGSYEDLNALKAAHPQGNPGDFYYIMPDLYVWDNDLGDWVDIGQIAGPQGLQGFQGEKGDQGPIGPTGTVGTVLGSFATLEELETEIGQGNPGDTYLVGNGELYVWSAASEEWELRGNLKGATGATGATGAAGPGGTAAIIPFSSGEAVALTSSAFGRSYIATVGACQGYQILAPSNPITLPVTTGVGQKQLAFSVPIDGVITSMSAYFSVSSAAVAGISNIVSAQLFYSAAPNNSFMPYAETKIDFEVPGAVGIGTNYHGIVDNLSIPISAGTRVIMIFYNVTPASVTSTLSGFMSGGIRIE